MKLFAYGSLVSAASAERTLGRPVERVSVTRLGGWRRRWSQIRDNVVTEKTFAHADTGVVPPHCVGLNLEREAGAAGPNGVLLEVSEAELERLALREIRYDLIELDDGLVTFTAKPENFAPTAPPGAVVLAPYVRAVEAAFGTLGAEQLELFHQTTGPIPVEVIESILVRDEIPAGNPRDW